MALSACTQHGSAHRGSVHRKELRQTHRRLVRLASLESAAGGVVAVDEVRHERTASAHPERQQQWVHPPKGQDRPPIADPGAAAARQASLLQLQLQLPQQPEPFTPAVDAESWSKQLTQSISSKRHWSQLQHLWLDNAASFGCIHLTATLCTLSRIICDQGVAVTDRPEVFKFSSALLSTVQHQLPHMDSRGLAQSLWAYAKIQESAPHSSRSSAMAAVEIATALLQKGHLQQLEPSQLSQAAWAMTTLHSQGMAAPPGWCAAVQKRMQQLLPHLKPCEVACCSWATTKLGHRLPLHLEAAVKSHVMLHSGDYRTRELLQIMLAVAGEQQQQPDLEHDTQQQQQHTSQWRRHVSSVTEAASTQPRKDSSWLEVCYTRLHQEAPCMTAQEVSTALLACSRLGARATYLQAGGNSHQLPLAVGTRLLQRAAATLPSTSPKVLASLVYALAQLELNPGPWWWATYLPYTAAALHVCSPSMMAVMAWSVAKLGVHPGDGWVQELLQQSGYKMRGFGAQEFCMLLHALGKWHAGVELWWWSAFEEASKHLLPYFTAAELAAILCGMGSTASPLSCLPSAPRMQHMHLLLPVDPHFQQSLLQPQQKQQQVAQESLTALATVHQQGLQDYTPSGQWTASMLIAAHNALSGAPAHVLAGLSVGLAKLGIHPSASWMVSFEAAVLHTLPHARLKEVAAVLWGMSVLGAQPSRALVQGVDTRIMSILKQATDGTFNAAHTEARDCRPISVTSASAPVTTAAAAVEQDGQKGDSSEESQLRQWRKLLGPLPASPVGGDAPRTARPSAAVAAQLLWSVAWLPQPQGIAAWADDLLTAVLPTLGSATQRTLLVLLRSLAWLRHAPGDPRWMDVWWCAYAAHLHVPSPHQAALRTAQQQSLQHGHGSPGQEQSPQQQCRSAQAERLCFQLTVVLWCFRRLQMQPSSSTGWLHTCFDFSQPLLGQLSAKRFSLLLSQMALLHVWPGESWLSSAEEVLLQHMHADVPPLQLQQLTANLRALGWVQRAPARQLASLSRV